MSDIQEFDDFMTKKYERIKFAHRFLKMPDLTPPTYLIGVAVGNYADFPNTFVDYDTAYFSVEKDKMCYYEIPDEGECLMLILMTGSRIWTTLRDWTLDKECGFRRNIGHEMEIIIEQP